MKRTFMIVLAALCALTSVSAAAPIDLKGDWDMSIETPMGAMPLALTIVSQEGEKISGVMSSPRGEIEVAGTIAEAKVTLAGVFPGANLTLTFTGKLENDVMSGEVDFGGMGAGTWSAKKK